MILRRFNGSVGDVLYSVSNLPPGVSVTGAVPNPMNGPDGSTAILTLSADSSAAPVQDRPLTLTGLPTPSAGQFGSHASSFPLTILDSYDAQVVGIEVTQSVQLYDLPAGSVGNRPLHGVPARYNGVPLALGGHTAVRVFPDFALLPSSSPSPDFVCTLVGTRADVTLPGSPLVTGPGPNPLILGANYVDDVTRARHNSECDFVLPTAWTSGVISLVATINAQPVLGPPVSEECCTDNNNFTLTDIAFTPTRDLVFAPFALRVNHDFLGFPDDVFAEAANTLPIGESQFQMGDYVGEIDITDIWNQDVKACGFLGTGSCPEDATGRGASANARLRSIADDLNFTESGMLVVGIYPVSDTVSGQSDRIRSDTQRGCTGPFWDCDDLQAIVVQNQLRPLTSAAHELGHMLGRVHASFGCGAGDTDNNGPAEHWLPDEQGFLQSVGVDRFSFRVWFPDRGGGSLGGPFYDFMSYCANPNDAGDPDAWISARGWVETIQALATGAPGSEARPLAVASLRRPAPMNPRQMLIVQGFVDLQGNVSVTKIAQDQRAPKVVPQSPYELVVFGRGGSALGRQAMQVTDATVHHEGTVTFLDAQVPVTGAEAIEILKDGKPIARRERDPEAPDGA